MQLNHVLLAIATTAVWGFNFVVVKESLAYFPPILLSALRFLLSALPIVFIPKPPVPWRYMITYGVLLGIIKFSLLFFSISAGMPAGLASLVLQVQAVFSVFIAAVFFKELPKPAQFFGLFIAFLGICVIAWGQYHAACLAAMLLLIVAAFSWSLSNFVFKRVGNVNMLHFMVWMSLVPPLPLLGLSAMVEGVDSWITAWHHLDWYAVGLLTYISFAATVLAFAVWGMLMARYPTSQVAPFSLLVPVFGMTSTALCLGECYSTPAFWGAMMAMTGLAVNILASHKKAR